MLRDLWLVPLQQIGDRERGYLVLIESVLTARTGTRACAGTSCTALAACMHELAAATSTGSG